ncbi:MAG: hypothetical protein FJ147_14890 [Deltaproteobacteria bacterium]|nr:hypothetical protein [Deltaproteobacteria bacterium]
MASNSHATFQKRQRERARQQKQQDKAARRLEIKQNKTANGPRDPNAEDPDIAGIVPGPQPLPEQWGEATTDS